MSAYYTYTKAYCVAQTILAQVAEQDREKAVDAVQAAFDTFQLTDAEREAVCNAVSVLAYPGIDIRALSIIIKTAVEKQRFIVQQLRGTVNG